MGALHDGHLALIRAAAAECDEVVVSIFVNPTQFDDVGDLLAYPRDEAGDIESARRAGARTVFVPGADEVYPPGLATSVHVGGVSERWEGEARGASHFDGVALVVCKLLLMVGPAVAWFGQKDIQQVAVVQRLVADLNIPVDVRVVPTVRDPDGLALSSRNVRLDREERVAALALSGSLREVALAAAAGERDARRLSERGRAMLEESGVATEYWAIVDPQTFEPLERLGGGEALAIVAGRVGDVRLIDNATIPSSADRVPQD